MDYVSVTVSKEYRAYCKGLTSEALCYIYQHSETKEEKDGTALELLERYEPFLKSKIASEKYQSQRGTFDPEDLLQVGILTLLQCASEYRESICPAFTVYMEKYVRFAISDYYFASNDIDRKHSSRKSRKDAPAPKSKMEYSLDGLEAGDKSDVRLHQRAVPFEDTVISKDEKSRLWDAMDTKLTEQERCIITMRDFNGEKWMDIANTMGVCRKTAQNVHNRALKKLKRALV